VTEKKDLSAAFEQSRKRLRDAASRMLGSESEAEDALQEVWLRLSRSDPDDVKNPEGWLSTVTARVCIDMLRSRKSRAEAPMPIEELPDIAPVGATNAEQEAVMAESIGLALLVVLDTLDPRERLAFVLHDVFALSFEEIAPIVGASEAATRQLASRARRRVRGAPERDDVELARQRDVVASLVAALRAGDVPAVVAVLDPDVLVRGQGPDGKSRETRGALRWAKSAVVFSRSVAAKLDEVEMVLVDGEPGAIYVAKGRVMYALRATFERGVITRVDLFDETAARGVEIERPLAASR
jgi:RNA polymerase sigma-70 factor (ECF subfamily)